MKENQLTLDHVCYAVSFRDLVESWIDLFHRDSHLMVIFDPIKHIKLLSKLGFSGESKYYESKILISEMDSLDSVMLLSRMISSDTGPYIQIWSLGHYITDNIDK